jgi:radical SAM protein with 4Fe4S-binding SPASM domain
MRLYKRRAIPNRRLEDFTILHRGERRCILNSLGSAIWEHLDGEISEAALARYLASQFRVNEHELSRATDAVLSALHLNGFIELTSGGIEADVGALHGNQANQRVPSANTIADSTDCATPPTSQTTATPLATALDNLYWKKLYIKKMHLELTYRCNFRCIHCYNTTHLGGNDELSTEQWISTLTQLADMGCYLLTFTGGELFVRGDVVDILSAACMRGFTFRINTNGSLLNERMVGRLEPLRAFMQAIDISFYGASPEVHDALSRKPGGYANTIRAVHLLREAGFAFTTKYITMKDNFDGLPIFERDMKALGIRYGIHTGSLIPRTDRNRGPLVQLLTDAQYRLFLSSHTLKTPGSNPGACRPGHIRGAITPQGDVSPCEWLTDFKCGNLKAQSLKEIWYSGTFGSFRKVFEEDSECPSCSLQPSCNRCPAHSYLETGNLLHCAPIQRHNAELYQEHSAGVG